MSEIIQYDANSDTSSVGCDKSLCRVNYVKLITCEALIITTHYSLTTVDVYKPEHACQKGTRHDIFGVCDECGETRRSLVSHPVHLLFWWVIISTVHVIMWLPYWKKQHSRELSVMLSPTYSGMDTMLDIYANHLHQNMIRVCLYMDVSCGIGTDIPTSLRLPGGNASAN